MALGAAALIGLNAAPLPALGKGLAVAMGLVGGAATFLSVLPLLVPLALVSGALYLLGIRVSDVKAVMGDFLGFIAGVPVGVRSALVEPSGRRAGRG